MKSSNEPWFKAYKRMHQDITIFSGKPRMKVVYDVIRSHVSNKDRLEIKEGRFKVNLKKGQCLISLHTIMLQTGGRPTSVKNDLTFLERHALISIKKIGQYLLIEDTNYEKFASDNFDFEEIFIRSGYDNVILKEGNVKTKDMTMSEPKQQFENMSGYDNVILKNGNVKTKKLQCQNRILSNREIDREIEEILDKPQMSCLEFCDFPIPSDSEIEPEILEEENYSDKTQTDYFLESIATGELKISIPLHSENDIPHDLDFQSCGDLPIEDMPESDINQSTGDLQTEAIIGFQKNQTGDQNSNLKVSPNRKRTRKRVNKFESIKAHDPKLITLVAAKGDSLVRAHIPDEVAEFTDFEIIPPDQNSGQVKKSRSRKKEAGGQVEEKSDGAKVFDAYNAAFQQKYKQPAVRNAMINALCKQLVTRLGVDDAIRVVEFYLTHNDAFYIKNLHMLKFAVNSAEKLLAEVNGGIKITGQMAQRNEFDQNNFDVINNYMMKKHGISIAD